tara:strand:+ start:31245 stop:32063 length:819 start_codon:yes stop_codon:yes gene_type:complete
MTEDLNNYKFSLKNDNLLLETFNLGIEKKQILIITINREKSLNAINIDILKSLTNILNHVKNDSNILSIILTGAGNKAFIAGADIKSMSTYSPEEAYNYSVLGQDLVKLINSFEKPIIAAINGYALGGGCEIASACHLRYASENSIFGQPEVKLGIIAGWGGTVNLKKLIGLGNATKLLISGNTINSDEAYRIGLVNMVFPLQNFLLSVIKEVKSFCQNSPNAIKNTLFSINSSDNGESYTIESDLFRDSFKHEDSSAGLSAFLKREKPKFK